MDDRRAVAWLHRRAGLGLGPTELAAAAARGPAAELQRLLAVPPPGSVPDPWDDAKLPLDSRDPASRLYAVHTWLDSLVTSVHPLVDRMAWLWHGHFVSGIDKVRAGKLMVDQIRLFRSAGLGSFTSLLRAVTIDPAMLIYLDLRTSTGTTPNENYARELLELFTLGAEAVTEADVQAGARALTGWTFVEGQARFVPRRHDDTPVTYLGRAGVHDLDTVIAAVAARPELATFVAAVLAGELLGTAPDELVVRLATTFREGGLDLRALVGATLQAGLEGTSAPVVLDPVRWLVQAQRATGASLDAGRRLNLLRAAGQVPMLPPNVAGWPGGPAWFAAGTVVARTNLAAAVAAGAPAGSPALAAARGADLDSLAVTLGLPDPFGRATADVLRAARPGAARLALALASPDFVIA